MVLKDLKTRGSRSVVHLSDGAIEALAAWRQKQRSEKVGNTLGLVVTITAGTLLDPRQAQKNWVAVVRKLGLPYVRPHDLRHTAANRLLSRGIHPEQVAEMLGHANPSITMRVYAHVPRQYTRKPQRL